MDASAGASLSPEVFKLEPEGEEGPSGHRKSFTSLLKELPPQKP